MDNSTGPVDTPAKEMEEKKPFSLGRGCLIPLVIVSLAIGVAMLLYQTREKSAAVVPEEKTWNVQAQTIQIGMHSPQIGLFGVVEAPRSARLTAAIPADVAAVPVRDGQTVSAGDLLVELDGAEAQIALDRAEADLALEQARAKADQKTLNSERELLKLAERALERARNLGKRNLSSQAQVDDSQRQYEAQRLAVINRELAVAQHEPRRKQLEAAVARAKLDFDRTRIQAPFDGQVTAVSVSVGDRMAPGQLIAEVFDPIELEIRAQIPNRSLAAVREALADRDGLNAEFTMDGRGHPAKLQRLSGASRSGSGGVDGFFTLANPEGVGVQPGRNVEVRVSMPAASDSFVLPFEALFGLKKIYRIDEARLAPVEVERIGDVYAADGTRQMLLRSDQIKAGDQVVVTQLPNAAAGLKVTVVDDDD